MKHVTCAQGSDEWRRARLGVPTASGFSRIITPAKKETKDGEIKGWNPTRGETRRAYAIHLLTEKILDIPLEGPTTPSMLHGHDWEARARAAYEMLTGFDIETCGFCLNDEGTAGASPDTLVGDEGLCQIKCPEKPDVHVGYLLDPQSLAEEHWVQLQGELYICDGRKWNDIISYFSGMPMARIRVEPDVEFQKRLDSALRTFVCELSDLVERAKERGWIKPKKDAPDYSRDWLTQADVDKILAARRGEHAIQ